MKILLVGAGGYGSLYVQFFLGQKDETIKLEGIVEKYPESCSMKAEIEAQGIPMYATMEEFYAHHSADLACIVTPPFLHLQQSACAMAHGSHVLCEKPVAPTVEEAEQMAENSRKYGKFLGIGYQWSYSDAIQALKKDVLSGALGKPVQLKTFISWPRNKAYYQRGGGWGGRIRKDGILILDSIASNACAHYLHNMFFLLGDQMNTSAFPQAVEAECLRANEIENFDTCVLRMQMANGAKLYFSATHAADQLNNPEFIYEFEKACVRFQNDGASRITALFSDGTQKDYGNPFEDNMKKVKDCIRCIEENREPVCTVQTAIQHTKLINQLYWHAAIMEFPKEKKKIREENQVYVEGLFEDMKAAYEKGAMLCENGADYTALNRFVWAE